MKHINSIEINNFRGIRHLELKGLKPITIFLGENSVGKSTVLESLFLVTGASNPFMALRITSLRAHKAISMEDAKYLFHDSDYSQIPSFSADIDGEKRNLSLVPSFSMSEGIESERLGQMGNTQQTLTGLTCTFDVQGSISYTGNSSIERSEDGNIKHKIDEKYVESLVTVSLSPYNSPGALLNEYGELIKMGRKEVILTALQLFDERISTIEATQDGLYLGYDHLSTLVPLSMAGDGVQKYLSIAIHAFRPSVDIIFIDEIENGLHFSAHKKLWKCIFLSAAELKKQLFISTHSQETLKCLASFMEEEEKMKDILNIVTLTRENDDIIPYSLSGYGLEGAMDNDVEIRK